jgi:hypothetical protein
MADNFKTFALNATPDCRVSMNFSFGYALPIRRFLEKVDIPRLFKNVSYWQGCKFKFRAVGVDKCHNFIDDEFYVDVPLLHYNVDRAADIIMYSYAQATRFNYNEPPNVKCMTLFFMHHTL